ncbi:MAG TPA: Ig-like domain-containing protein [Thermoanaerobaculia bacterium]|nr:Ig-like domain-containing protein [Thermoanaerobaculia bacterium]
MREIERQKKWRGGRAWSGAAALLLAALALAVSPLAADGDHGSRIFGPKEYVRTTGAPNTYTDTFTLPGWIVAPFTLHVQNGDDDGRERVSSATILINSKQVLGPSDFNPHVGSLDRQVTLTAQNTLKVTLASSPGSFLVLTLSGASGDHQGPTVKIVAPADGSAIRTATPFLDVSYGDPDSERRDDKSGGNGHGHGSGCDSSTLKITLDGVDRTSLFTRRSGDATATLPQSLALAPGLHTLFASLSDRAGNSSTATSRFTVDLAAPQIAIVAPTAGSYLATTKPAIHVTYQDNIAVDLQSLHILVNGVDRTSLFAKTSTGATWTPTSSTALPQGANQITAKIADTAGNLASTSIAFNVDLTKPVLTITSPAAGSHQGSSSAPVTVTYRDDQALDLPTLQVTVDGHAVAMTAGASSATGTATGLAGGSHTLAASVKDKAGNAATATVTFVVDTAAPSIKVVAPAPGAFVRTASPTITIDYSGSVNTATFKASLNGADITSLFTVGAGEATVDLAGKRTLPEGLATVSAQIASPTGAVGSTTSTFTVDTTAPAVAITAPAGTVGTGTPAATVTYSDAGSGIDVTAVHILLDGADVTSLFALTAGNAVGTLTPRLADGAHTLSATVADRAGNARTASVSFQVDTTPPTAAFTAPADNSFLNVKAPSIVLTYGDGTGAGVTPASVHIFLTPDGGTETEITGYFTVGAQQASGQIPAASPLADGTYHLRASLADQAGNAAAAQASFELDTVAPTDQIVQPASSSVLATNTPAILISYQDDASGVDTAKLVLKIDGVDKSSLLVASDGQATATLGAADALADGPHTITVTVVDRAGNTAPVVPQSFTVDTVGPTIQAAPAPPPNAAGWNSTDVTVTFTCADSGSGVAVCPAPVTVATEGANQVVSGSATDAAGTAATASVTLNIDKTPPTITAAAAPAPNAAGWYTGPVTVTFTCADALSGVASCQAPVTVSTEGASQVVSGTVTDKAGNSATASVTVNVESPGSPPRITASASPAANAAGWNNSDVTVTYVCTPSVSPIAHCPAPRTVSTEGAGQVIAGTVQDQAGNQATASVTLNIDKTPPTLTQLDVPSQLPPGGTGTVSVTATDNLSLAAVAFQVGGTTVATVTAPPYQFVLTVPPGARSGETLTVTAVATDAAGNSASASHGVTVASAGVVVGQVLADSTGLPLPGVVVQVVGGAQQDITDGNGRYSLAVSGSHLFLQIGRPADPNTQTPALLPVEREVIVQPGVGTVPVDARLTALAAAVSIDAAGGALSAGDLTVAVPAGAVGEATAFHLTRLSAQGLPALLPLGWSPVAAFDLRVDAAAGPTAPLGASFAGLPKNRPLQLVTYNPGLHAWILGAADLSSADGTLSVSLPALGGYALIVADAVTPPHPIPEAGQPLEGLGMIALPADATSAGSLSPPSLSPAGGTSMATLTVQSSAPLPSGTVIQANVTEVYTLNSGEQLSEPARAEDLVLYGFPAPAGATLAATFPVTPSRSFQVSELQTGKVHLDILAGRENVRGETGGSGAVVVQEGDATLSVAAGSLPEDSAIDLTAEPLATFLPAGNGLTPLSQYEIDFGGEVLGLPAQLAAGLGSAQPGDTLLLAQIQRFGGVPRLVVVSLAQVTGGQIVTQSYPGLPGITRGGEYVFYKSAVALGFVAGRVSSSGGPVAALISTDALPFVTLSDATGRYTIPAAAGTANLKATVPQTALLATGSVAVTAGQTAALDLTLAGAVTAAIVNPADGALGVDPSAPITITSADALNPATVSAGNVQLFQAGSSGNQPVAVRFVLAQGNRQISVFPLAALAASTRYTLQVTGLATAVGGLVAVPSVTFTTRSVTPPNFNPDALVFAFPDADGNVAVSAPAGSFPPGTRVLVVDQTNGVVVSLTVRNDGSVSGELPATINDVLLVTLTAPDGSATSFNRSQFVAPDGTVAVGASGGTVTGPGGVELRIPEGALDHGVRLKIEAFGPERFPERPDVPSGSFGSGLKVSSPDKLAFKKELKLAFPKPADAPDGSFFYVYRRLATADGKVAFEIIDHAFVEGQGAQAKVVTASAPFPGFITGMGALAANPATAGLASALEDSYFFLEWSFDRLLVGIASQGVVVGKVRRIVPPGPGKTDPTYTGIGGAMVYLSDDDQIGGGGSIPGAVAISQADGTFSIWDRKLGGGTRKVTAVVGSEKVEATAFEVDAAQPDPVFFPNVQIFQYYRNVGKVNIAFPSLTPSPPAPQVDIHLFTLDADGLRVPAPGVLPSGTSLVVAFKSSLTVTGATIGGAPQSVTAPDLPDDPQDPLKFDSRVVGTYTVGPPGVYTVVATALPPLGGPAVTSTRSFLAVAAGGNNSNPTPGIAPKVVQTAPLEGSQGVSVSIFPQVTFSEPVTGLMGNVRLSDSRGLSADIRLIGVRADGTVANPVQVGDAVTAVTVQPTTGLKFGEVYTLVLGTSIADQNQPPLPLAPFTLHFTTFGPEELGGTATFSSTRPIILGQRAYVGKYVNTSLSALDIVDISNPATPVEVGSPAYFVGRAIDIAGMDRSPVTGGALVAVAAGVGPLPLPSNLWIYDVSNPDVPSRVAAVSATTSAGQDGTLLRIAMKGGSIYASTFPKGIQVIDVQQAMIDYQDHEGIDFGRAITTEGQGFATDAVVNTIPLTTGQGSIATMYDLEAGDFATEPPNPADPTAPVPTETLVVATGRLPFVVVDPLQSGPGAVLYPPRDSGGTGLSTVPLQSADGRFQLELGHALALGSLQRTDADGNSSSLPVALVVGTGTVVSGGSSVSGATLFAVVDLTDPRHPAPLGFLQLSDFAGDVVLKDSFALVTVGGKIRLISLTDPAHPSDAGEITGAFGDRLAVSSSGIVVTASVNGTVGGVHTATLVPGVFTQCDAPILAKQVSPDSASTPVFETLDDVTCAVRVIPSSTPAGNGRFTLTQQNLTTTSSIDLRTGATRVIIPAGRQITGNTLNAQATAVDTRTGERLPSFQQTLAVGSIHLVLDSNNDTKLDAKVDDPARRTGSKFSFWQADPANLAKLDGLLDYAPLRLYVNGQPNLKGGKIKLILVNDSTSPTTWVLTKNMGVPDHSADVVAQARERLYITDKTTAAAQLAQVASGNAATCGSATSTSFVDKLCVSGLSGDIELPDLQAGQMYDLLLSCRRPNDPLSNPPNVVTLKVVLVKNDQSMVELDSVPVDIRPLERWMSVYTARFGTGFATPLSKLMPEHDWAEIPGEATKLNVLVHGYNNSDLSATQEVFPSFFKRLYWAEHPVMLSQGNVHTVGISWPGDVSLPNWPDDEFSALESGVPVAKFFDEQARKGREIRILAHSLGNMVVNSALIRSEAQEALIRGAIKKYVMNDAAIPSEAFDPGYLDQDLSNLLVGLAILKDGFFWNGTWDGVWQDQWQAMRDQADPISALQLLRWNNTVNDPNYLTQPPPQYDLRWRQQRPAGLIPDSAPITSTPQRGSWLGLFSGNPRRVTMYNSFNSGDLILGGVWMTAQVFEKPNILTGVFGLLPTLASIDIGQSDGPTLQFWAKLRHTDGGQEILWDNACITPATCSHSNILRQWAELAYWFPSVSKPVGSLAIDSLTNLNFSSYAPNIAIVPSHSYMGFTDYTKVYGAWVEVRKALQ